jgi:hypothetical protein
VYIPGSGVILAIGLNSETTPNSDTNPTADHIFGLVAAVYQTLVQDHAIAGLPAPHHAARVTR